MQSVRAPGFCALALLGLRATHARIVPAENMGYTEGVGVVLPQSRCCSVLQLHVGKST